MCSAILNAFTLYNIIHVRWTIAGFTSIVTLIQTVIVLERSPVLTRLTVTVPLSSMTLTRTALNSMVATNGEMTIN